MWIHDDPMTQARGIAAAKVHRRACSARRRDSERRDGPPSFAADENSRSNSHLSLSTGDRRPVQRYHRGPQGRHASYAGEDAGKRRMLHFSARSPCGFQSTLNSWS